MEKLKLCLSDVVDFDVVDVAADSICKVDLFTTMCIGEKVDVRVKVVDVVDVDVDVDVVGVVDVAVVCVM